MVALQRDPGAAARRACHQVVHHGGAFGPAVHKITQVDHRGVVIAGHRPVGGDHGMGGGEFAQMAVDVADGIGADHRPNP